MKNARLAQRYARGLAAALADENLDSALGTLRDLRDTLAENPKLEIILANGAVNIDRRRTLLEDLLNTLGANIEVERFAKLMLDRGRITGLAEVEEEFAHIADARLGRVEAHVVTAHALSAENEQRLRTGLETYAGKTVRLRCKVDEYIIGGVVATIDGRRIDGSLRSRLDQIKRSLIDQETQLG
jgi:F-type H+-transporting ATPase subunit delta